MADGDHDVLESVAVWVVIVDVSGADDTDADSFGELHEGTIARAVAEDKVVLQLDKDIIDTEPMDETTEGNFGLDGVVRIDESRDETISAASEEDEAGGVVG